MTACDIESEVKYWLKNALKAEDLKDDFSIKFLENTAKGDGYMGDIVFVHLAGTTKQGVAKQYDFVLKCGKRSQVLRDNAPVREAFLNEIYIYTTVFPKFVEFQRAKGVDEVFDSIPESYGSYCSDTIEILVLQNLKTNGYSLWDKKKPVTTKHMKMVLGEYGKLHAISAAMQDQQPREFKKVVAGLEDIWTKFLKSQNLTKVYVKSLEDGCEVLKGALDNEVWNAINQFKEQVPYILEDIVKEKCFRAILQRDCWNNNFMYKSVDGNEENPKKVVMLDWQISSYSSPILDVAYFMYAAISKEDLSNFDEMLSYYHNSFSKFVKLLGSDPDQLYPFKQLQKDWKRFGKYGIMMAFTALKVSVIDKEDVVDMSDVFDNGGDMSDIFNYEVKNKDLLRDRLKYLVEHAVQRKFLD